MTEDLKPYPSMKDSGVPWLGEVPEHWHLGRLKSSVRNVNVQTGERRSGDLYVALEHVESWTGRIRLAGADASFDSQVKRFEAGDVLFGKLRPYLAKVARPTNSGVCVGEFFVLRPQDATASSPYIELLLRSKPNIDAVNSSTFGAKMPRADWHFLGGMKVTIPPILEQAAIVRFLDHADRRIRRYIRAKQKLIKLLEEQKQAIIHRALTRGLDPDVRLEPSGVEWLGDVPEHWEVRRAKALFSEVDQRSTNGEEELLSLRMYQGLVPHRDVSSVPISADALVGYKKVLPGQIVMNRMRAAIGMFGIARRPGLVSPDYAVFGPRVHMVTEYFLRLFKTPAAADVFRIESKGLGTGSSGFMRLYTERFGIIKLPVPPVEEQDRIVNRIAEEIEAIEAIRDRLTREVALIREYRIRLIADVVTGKLDVREAAARLPDEADEPEPFDEADDLADTDEEMADDAELEEAEA